LDPLHEEDLETLRSRAFRYLRHVRRPATSSELSRVLFRERRFDDGLSHLLVRTLLGRDRRFEELERDQWQMLVDEDSLIDLEAASFAVVDLEATGSDANADEIIEIGIVRVEGLRIVSSYASLVRPQVPIPTWIRRLTGIEPSSVAAAPAFSQIAPRVLAEVDADAFVAHNVDFDYPFLLSQLRRHGHAPRMCPQLCTVRLARRFIPKLSSYKLDAVAEHMGVSLERHHRAVDDAVATAQILLNLLDELLNRGYRHLQELPTFGVHPRVERRVRRAGMT
jgi:DNA polymerase III epsilon subunit family exonuclease